VSIHDEVLFLMTADHISFFLYYVFFGIGMQVRIPIYLVSNKLLTGCRVYRGCIPQRSIR
jgi:hypothetical protein